MLLIGYRPRHLINNINLQLNKFPLKIGRIEKLIAKVSTLIHSYIVCTQIFK